ncbi:MAG TPA: ABC transporter ATP-binding protein, partial [Chthoniobacteraceae bacterium]
RVALARLLLADPPPQLLVLDEPTNDLDLATLRLLEEALLIFDGSVIVVSHDRYFLNRICTSILAFEDGTVHRYVGNYDYYLEKRVSSTATPAVSAKAQPAASSSTTPAKAKKLKWKEERELETMEATILEAENEVARLETLFATPDFFQMHGSEIEKFEKQLADARHKVAQLYARWAELEKVKTGAAAG